VCKVSGPFRSSVEGHPWRDVDPFVEAVLEAFTPDRCVWGSDWPFVRMDERVDYGPALAWLRRVVPDEARREKLLWSTPARLFGFASPA
jgi:predicted TIM-barrel fold metal-dependent hydrolase